MRISLRGIFGLLAIVSVFLAIEFALPWQLLDQANMILWVATSAIFGALVVYGKGSLRAFSAGAMIPHALLCYVLFARGIGTVRAMMALNAFNAPLDVNEEYRLITFVTWTGSLFLGVSWVGIRNRCHKHYLEQRG
jgi:hypothetical protein